MHTDLQWECHEKALMAMIASCDMIPYLNEIVTCSFNTIVVMLRKNESQLRFTISFSLLKLITL